VAIRVDFFFSPASRYSYLACTQIAQLERDTGCSVVWRPVHGPEIRRLRGRDPFAGVALSGQYEIDYRRRDAEAWAAFYGVPYTEPPEFHFDYELLVKAAVAGQLQGAGPVFLLALSAAVYGFGRWPIDQALVIEIAERHDVDQAKFSASLSSPRVAEIAALSAAEAVERGAFGVPTFFIGARMFWGNDRIPLVRYALQSRGCENEAE
jgi:2-hydroxychromene-2-carboxylate isomerase